MSGSLAALSDGARLALLAGTARLKGRAHWALLFRDGKLLTELERDWLETPKRGRQAIRLYCPDGRVAEFGSQADASGRLFQFKVARRKVGLSYQKGRALALVSRRQKGGHILAHVVGVVDDTAGACTCMAWEYGEPRDAMNPAPLLAILRRICVERGGWEQVAAFAKVHPDALRLALGDALRLSLKEALAFAGAYGAAYGFDAHDVRGWYGIPQLYGPWHDNVNRMQYGLVGKLNEDHLGMARQ